MKVAVYHNLPPGGARRALWEFLRRSCGQNDYDLFSIDMGRADGFSYARGHAEQQDFRPYVAREHRYPLLRGFAARIPLGKAQPLDAVRRIGAVERKIAEDINRGSYDVVYVHPCQVTHTPSVLRWLTVPSLHYMQEPRRRSFEAGYRPAVDLKDPGTVPRWIATTAMERTLRRRDILAAGAAGRLACNSYYSAETIRRAYGRDAEVCYLGVDTETFTTTPSGWKISGLHAMSVGALDRVKGHDLVVRAVGLLPPHERPVVNLVFERCDDAYRSEVESLAAGLGVELRLHRGISDSDLATLYRSSTVSVMTARLEPFGLVPLESLACGTPVVAVREAGYRETVEHGINGFLVGRSPEEIADAVRRVVRGELRATPDALRASVTGTWAWDASVKRQLEMLAATAARNVS